MKERALARVFPRFVRSATPTDGDAYLGPPSSLFPERYAEVHVSCVFDSDRGTAERLRKAWRRVAGEVQLGGPAYGDPGGEFVAGRYLRPGYTITTRGCPNRCWYCAAWRREGNAVRELPIVDGWNVLDSNLLAAEPEHVQAVFAMLRRQGRGVRLTGGLDARRFVHWHAAELATLPLEVAYFANDRPGDPDHLERASTLLGAFNLIQRGHRFRCYVLVGYEGDTIPAALERLRWTAYQGYMPMAMLFNRGDGRLDKRAWKDALAPWISPVRAGASMRAVGSRWGVTGGGEGA